MTSIFLVRVKLNLLKRSLRKLRWKSVRYIYCIFCALRGCNSLRWVFHIYVHICILLHLIQSQVQRHRSNRDHICHWASPSFLPILCGVLTDWSIYQVHQMSVNGSAGSSGAVYNSGSWGTEDLVSGAAVAVDYSVGIAFGDYSPNFLPYVCKWGSLVPINIIPLLWCCYTRVGCSWAWGSIFMGGFEVVTVVVLLVGGISHLFSIWRGSLDIFPALGHGVPVQTGIFLSGWGVVHWSTFQGRFLIFWICWSIRSSLRWLCSYITGLRVGSCHNFDFIFLGRNESLPFLSCFCLFLYMGLVLVWVSLDWLDWGWKFGPNFPSNSRSVFIFLIIVDGGRV